MELLEGFLLVFDVLKLFVSITWLNLVAVYKIFVPPEKEKLTGKIALVRCIDIYCSILY